MITKHRPAWERFFRGYKTWQIAIQSIRATTNATRDELYKQLRETGYKPSN